MAGRQRNEGEENSVTHKKRKREMEEDGNQVFSFFPLLANGWSWFRIFGLGVTSKILCVLGPPL